MNAEALAIAAGSSFLAGTRLYACVALLGLAFQQKWLAAPGSLEVLARPEVIGVATFLAVIEFLADKIPWIDTVWDSVSTFIRVPGGAALAAAALSGHGSATTVIAAMLGGTFALGVHGTKTATRAAVNTSPEPASNWFLSFAEDFGVFGVIALMIVAPVLLLILLALTAYGLYRLAKWANTRRKTLKAARATPPDGPEAV